MNDDNTNTQALNEEEILASLTNEETINVFVRGLMEEKGSAVGSEEMQNDIFAQTKASLMEEIDRSLVAELPDEKLEELNKMAEENGKIEPEVIADAVAEAGIDTTAVIAGTMEKFREIYLGKESDDDDEEEIVEEDIEEDEEPDENETNEMEQF